MHIIAVRLFGLVFVFTGLCGELSAQRPVAKPSQFESIRNELSKKVADGSVPSVSVGVIKNGKVVWRESFGFADVAKKIRATPDTVYALGSLSKSITGTAVFRLVQDGKIDLDQPISRYLRSQRIDYHGRDPKTYKVYHLLNMAAGIPHFWRYCFSVSDNSGACGTELLDQASFSAFAPGEVHLYSNLSMDLAARLAADVAKQPFSQFLKARLFRPAGMQLTFTHRKEIPATASVARPYRRDNTLSPDFQFEPSGGGGFYSTLNDLLRYGSLHLRRSNDRNAVLKNSTLFRDHQVRRELKNRYYANGWGVLPLPGRGTTLLSNGAIEGAASTLLVMPESDLVIVVLINKTVGNDVTDEIAFNIAEAILPGYRSNLKKLIDKIGPLFSDVPFTGNRKTDGIWSGSVLVEGKPMNIRLVIQGSEIYVEFGSRARQKLSDAVLSGGIISGKLEFSPFEPPLSRSAALSLAFRISGNSLSGYLQTEILEPRPDRLLSYYVSAKKQ